LCDRERIWRFGGRQTGEMDRIFHLAEEFPPVTLYKNGDSYFVLDGNHRVSVARFHGVEGLDAVVTQFSPPGAGKGTSASSGGRSPFQERDRRSQAMARRTRERSMKHGFTIRSLRGGGEVVDRDLVEVIQ
jgi:hypothetical protein